MMQNELDLVQLLTDTSSIAIDIALESNLRLRQRISCVERNLASELKSAATKMSRLDLLESSRRAPYHHALELTRPLRP